MGNLRKLYSPYTKKLQQQQRERELQRIKDRSEFERRIFIAVSIISASVTGLIFLYMRAYLV